MSKWISVDKQLPKKDELVLTITNGKPTNNITLIDAYELGEYTDGGWIIAEWPKWRDAKVTHWIPLPEPPGEMTVFDQLTESPEALAKLILRMHSRDISLEWCKEDKAEACVKAMDNGDFVCTDERLTECIISWLQSPAEEG